ncbi:MAG: alpha/beta hydrolase [Proteobacteria bacterium]|nr:alpha/beta hydrolase [Pseudomonadota bacterium]
MPLDPRAKRFLDTLAALNPPGALSLSPAQRREGLRHLLSFSGTAESVAATEDRTIAGPAAPLALRVYTPASAGAADLLPGLVYFHGGGLVAGSLDTHDPICRALVNAAGCRLVSVDYRLGPEARFPAAVEDGLAALQWVAAHTGELHIDPRRLGISGDSAGATLAAVVASESVRTGGTRLACQFLLCPIMDFAAESESRREFAHGYLVDRETLAHDLRYYLGPDADPADPRVSPLRVAEVAGLPPTVVHTAEFDPLRDEGREYAERLAAAGVTTRYRCHPGMIHLFYGMRALIPYATTAFGQMGADIRGLLEAA